MEENKLRVKEEYRRDIAWTCIKGDSKAHRFAHVIVCKFCSIGFGKHMVSKEDRYRRYSKRGRGALCIKVHENTSCYCAFSIMVIGRVRGEKKR